MLSRRTNIKSPMEIEAARTAARPIQPRIIIPLPRRYSPMTPEQRAERNRKISELWLARNSMREISELTGFDQGTIAGVIVKLGLQGMGGKCKKFIKRRYKTPTISETA